MSVLLEWKEPEPFACGGKPFFNRVGVIELLGVGVLFGGLLWFVLNDLSKPAPAFVLDVIIFAVMIWIARPLAHTLDVRFLRRHYQKYFTCQLTPKGIRLRDTRFVKWREVQGVEIIPVAPAFQVLKFNVQNEWGIVFFDPREVDAAKLCSIFAEYAPNCEFVPPSQ